jgi:hypothetical protein
MLPPYRNAVEIYGRLALLMFPIIDDQMCINDLFDGCCCVPAIDVDTAVMLILMLMLILYGVTASVNAFEYLIQDAFRMHYIMKQIAIDFLSSRDACIFQSTRYTLSS